MLPKGKQLVKMLKEAEIRNANEAEEKRIKAEIAKEKKMKAEEVKLKKDVEGIIKHIEEDIFNAIKKGKRETELRFGDGHTREPAWEMAVAQLGRLNKAYKFKIDAISIHCDNHIEAANVDYVTARDWYEPRWEVKIKW
jgi:hypothetical protein